MMLDSMLVRLEKDHPNVMSLLMDVSNKIKNKNSTQTVPHKQFHTNSSKI
jgi:hypothetical protein